MRRQAMRMRSELELPWKEIARVVGVNIHTVMGWSKRYSMLGESGLKSKTRDRRYLSGRTLSLAQEWPLRSIIVGENPQAIEPAVCAVESPGSHATDQGSVRY